MGAISSLVTTTGIGATFFLQQQQLLLIFFK